MHGVPGCGKTSFIKELLVNDPNLVCITSGVSHSSILGTSISKVDKLFEGKADIIDEYPPFKSDLLDGAKLIFADPDQYCEGIRPCHFYKSTSHRFGAKTANLLNSLGFTVQAQGLDKVELFDIFSTDPEGLIIAFEDDVCDLLKRHNLRFSKPLDCLGQQVDVATFITSSSSILEGCSCKHLYYIALTRHRRKLKILSPNATFGTS